MRHSLILHSLRAGIVAMLSLVSSQAQTWQVILPSGDSPASALTANALCVAPQDLPFVVPSVFLGTIDYAGGDTVLRVTAGDQDFETAQIEGLDRRMVFVSEIAHVPGQGYFALGRVAVKNKRDTSYYWNLRQSATGARGTWQDAEPPFVYPGRQSGDSYPYGMAADFAGNLYATGVALGGEKNQSSWRWIVRRKMRSDASWSIVLDQPIPGGTYAMRPGICHFPGNSLNPVPAILTAAHLGGIWTVLRSQNGGPFQVSDSWVPENGGSAAARRIIHDPVSGNLYAVGYRGNITDQRGWLVRVSRDGGQSWDALPILDAADQWGGAEDLAIDAHGNLYLAGNIHPSGSQPVMTVVRNRPGQSWADSWSQRLHPFQDAAGHRYASYATKIGIDASGVVYVAGDVADWTEETPAGAVVHPGRQVALVRLTWAP